MCLDRAIGCGGGTAPPNIAVLSVPVSVWRLIVVTMLTAGAGCRFRQCCKADGGPYLGPIGHGIQHLGPAETCAYLWSMAPSRTSNFIHVCAPSPSRDTLQIVCGCTGVGSSVFSKTITVSPDIFSIWFGTVSSIPARFGTGTPFRAESGEAEHECIHTTEVGMSLFPVPGAGACAAMSSDVPPSAFSDLVWQQGR